MPNGKSRAKGKRGELDVMHRLGAGAKRIGHSFQAAPDVVTAFAVYSVKNCPVSGGLILAELHKLQEQEPKRNHYVVFKPKTGCWVVTETLEQHVGDHGEDKIIKGERGEK